MNEKRAIRIDDKDLFKPSEVAEIIGVTWYTVVYKYIHKGLLKAHKIGNGTGKRKRESRHWRIWKEDLIDFLNRGSDIKGDE